MNLPDKCPFCGAGVRAVKDGNQHWVEFECFSLIGDVGGELHYRSPICRHAELNAAKARVAELEARTRESEESNANALARLSAAEATIQLKRAENEAVRRQLGRAENACDALEARVAELEAQNAQLQSELDHIKARAKELEAETLRLEDLAKHRGKLMTQAVDQSRDLEARVAELEARCKRLEKAAREVYIDSIASDHMWTHAETRNMHALRDVLEDKP